MAIKTYSGMGGGGGGSWGDEKKKTKSATTLGVGGSRAPVKTPTVYSTPATPTKSTASTYTAPKTTAPVAASVAPATPVVEQDAPEWLSNAPSMGGGRSSGSRVTSSDYYQKMLDEQQAAIQQRIDSAVDQNNAYIPQVNQRSDQSLQNAYILREQNKYNAPQALSALGYNGGAAESSMLGINTGYENTRNEVEENRGQSLDEIYQNEQQIRATGDATKAEAAASYYQNLVAAQAAAEARAQEQANWQAEFEQSEQQYADAAAQQAWQNQYDERVLATKNKSAATAAKTGSSTDTNKTSAYYSTADRLLSTLSVPSSMTALIKQYNSDGRLSDAEATALLRKYGLTW